MISFVFTMLVCSLIEKEETPIKYLHLLAFSGQSFTHFIIKHFAQKRGNPLISIRENFHVWFKQHHNQIMLLIIQNVSYLVFLSGMSIALFCHARTKTHKINTHKTYQMLSY